MTDKEYIELLRKVLLDIQRKAERVTCGNLPHHINTIRNICNIKDLEYEKIQTDK